MLYTKANEAPDIFHFWSGLTVLAHALGRKVYLDRGYFSTYPGQMIVCLVGPSGSRKSTAINLATSILAEIPDVNILANKLSGPTLLDSLDRGMAAGSDGIIRPADSLGFIAAPELSVFLPKAQYVEEIIPILTDLFDAKAGPWKHKTRGFGLTELMSPMVTGLWGSTPDWLESNIPQNAYGGGFMSRIFFIWHPKTIKSNPLPETSPLLERLRKELLAELLWVHNNVEGKITWEADAKVWYIKFYEMWNQKEDSDTSSQRQGYNNRRPEHLVRIAMCLVVSENHNLILTREILEMADNALELVESVMHKCFETQAPMGVLSKNFRLILEELEKGQKTKRDLQRKLWKNLSATELSVGLQTFIDADMVEVIQMEKSIGYKLVGGTSI